MNYKVLGKRTGLPVSEFALGTAMFGQTSGYGADAAEVKKMIASYMDHGGNFIDTADNYQHGESEELIGKTISGKRNDLVIASKYTCGIGNTTLGSLGNHRKNLVQAVENSLKRLDTDRIDIYYVNMDDMSTPMEEIMRGLDDLTRSGKIVYSGISNFPAWRIATASTLADLRGWTPICTIQVEYSLLQRTTERELLPMAEGFGLGVLTWSPLAGGLLTGKYRKGEEGRATRLEGSIPYEDSADADVILDELFSIAEEVNMNSGQVALAWLKTKNVIPILGARTVTQLEDNLRAISLQLSERQVKRLDETSVISLGYPHELNSAKEHRSVVDWR